MLTLRPINERMQTDLDVSGDHVYLMLALRGTLVEPLLQGLLIEELFGKSAIRYREGPGWASFYSCGCDI